MRSGFRPDIQGLRAVAVLAVLADHAGVPFLGGGYVGVDVFFVISGFLISGQLFDRLASSNRIGFADFYSRRARRILPAAFVVIVLSMVGALVWMPPLLLPQTLSDALATALYVPNYAFALQGTDYLSITSPSLFQHYWSLGVEEQFYLLWPALLGMLWLVARVRARAWVLPAALGVVVVASLAACVIVTARDQPWAFFPLWTRAWELGAGGLLAVALRRSADRLASIPPTVRAAIGWLGLGMILLAVLTFSAGTAFPGIASALPVAGAVLAIAGGSGGRPPMGGPVLVLARRPMQFVGRISYSLYLVHWPLLILGGAALGPYATLSPGGKLLLAAAAVPLAWLLNVAVEQPARGLALLRRARPRRTLLAAGAATAVVACLAVAALVATTVMPLDAGRSVAEAAPSAPPAAASVVPSNLQPALRDAADDNPALYADGCEVGFAPSVPHPCLFGEPAPSRVVLFGDSHAAQWFPALDALVDDHEFQLETQTKSACPSAAVKIERGGTEYARCDSWRRNVIAQLRADPPDLVVLANYTNPDFADQDDTSGQWQRGLSSTIDQLSEFTRVAVIADTPDFRLDPAVCLSAHLDSAADCARPAELALSSPGRTAEQRAVAASGADYIDLTPYFCTDECSPIIGSTLVYRDSHHVTATFSTELAEVLRPRIASLLG